MATIQVEKQLCMGHGMCEALRPDLMRLGGEGFGEVVAQPVPGTDEDELLDLVEACPASALTLGD